MKYKDYFEKKQRGTIDFPIEYYYVDRFHQHYIMPLHWHNDFEIIRVKKGIFNAYLENVKFSLKEGEVLLVPPGCLHRGEPENAIYECIVFKIEMLIRNNNDAIYKLLLPFINLSAQITKPKYLKGSEISKFADNLFFIISKKPPYYELEVLRELYSIFFSLFNNNGAVVLGETLHSSKSETISRILEWIERNINEDITLKKLSEISGFSEKYLCKIFKSYTSKTVIGYVNELRIEKAGYDIKFLGKNVTNAAYNNGFNDLSYFCKLFKKRYGITPNQYKNIKTPKTN